MQNLPLPVKIIINIIIASSYFLFVFFLSAFFWWFISALFWYEDLPVEKIIPYLALIAFISLIFTIVFRKNFYLMNKNPINIKNMDPSN